MAHPDRPPAVLPGSPWMIAFGEGLSSYRPPVDLKTVDEMIDRRPTATRKSVSTSSRRTRSGASTAPTPTTCMMLTLNRGGPTIWLSEDDAKAPALPTTTGWSCSTPTAHCGACGGEPARQPGMVMMYHAQEKDHQHPRCRNHRHTRRHPQLGDPHRHQAHPHDRWLRPVQLASTTSGTIGTNRDEFVIVPRCRIDWHDGEGTDSVQA